MIEVKDYQDPYLRKIIRKKKQLAILPVGSIEQHGPHLPVSTDLDIVKEISRLVAERENYLLLPAISYGVSFEHSPFFNLSLKKSTLKKTLIDLCLSLCENNIRVIFVINGHHGNLNALKNLEKTIHNRTNGKFKVFVFSYWKFMEKKFDHAGFVETSIMLAISNKVKMKRAQKGLTTEGLTRNEISKITKLASKSFPSVTKNGVWGDPRKSNQRDGKKLLSEIVTNLTKKCQTCLAAKTPKLYQ